MGKLKRTKVRSAARFGLYKYRSIAYQSQVVLLNKDDIASHRTCLGSVHYMDAICIKNRIGYADLT